MEFPVSGKLAGRERDTDSAYTGRVSYPGLMSPDPQPVFSMRIAA
jgi:hypothetical protein